MLKVLGIERIVSSTYLLVFTSICSEHLYPWHFKTQTSKILSEISILLICGEIFIFLLTTNMLTYLIFVCFLQSAITYEEESSCGCNVARTMNKKSSDTVFGASENLDQCSTINEINKSVMDDQQFNELERMVLIPGGQYQIGTDDVVIEKDMEGPKRISTVDSFYLDKYEVSNKDFSSFVSQTSYKTEAETFGDSFVFSIFLNNTFKEKLKDFRVVQATWWYKVLGADWMHPYGPDSEIKDILDHPVIHVSWKDAKAYCKWRSARLPSEAEWEAACRGGHQDTKYPWGDKLFPGKKHMVNIWQGTFPHHNSAKDGFVGTNAVHLFPPNDFGLHNMAGNVWEWTEDAWSKEKPSEKVKKGGSYLCHHSYCYRYRCSARSHNTEDSSAGNLGFRCAKSK